MALKGRNPQYYSRWYTCRWPKFCNESFATKKLPMIIHFYWSNLTAINKLTASTMISRLQIHSSNLLCLVYHETIFDELRGNSHLRKRWWNHIRKITWYGSQRFSLPMVVFVVPNINSQCQCNNIKQGKNINNQWRNYMAHKNNKLKYFQRVNIILKSSSINVGHINLNLSESWW